MRGVAEALDASVDVDGDGAWAASGDEQAGHVRVGLQMAADERAEVVVDDDVDVVDEEVFGLGGEGDALPESAALVEESPFAGDAQSPAVLCGELLAGLVDALALVVGVDDDVLEAGLAEDGGGQR